MGPYLPSGTAAPVPVRATHRQPGAGTSPTHRGPTPGCLREFSNVVQITDSKGRLLQLSHTHLPITFQAVQREAGVSHAFLDGHPGPPCPIEHLRVRTRPHPQRSAPPESDSTLVLALTAQIAELKKRHRHDVKNLRDALEKAHGENLDLRRELARRGPGPSHLTTHVASIATAT